MKRALLRGAGVALVALGIAWALDPHPFLHVLGIDTQQSYAYDFFSGPGPCLISAVGLGGIIAGGWHRVNCHEPGCWRIARHHVNGTPWCNVHHETARPERTTEELLAEISAKLDDLIAALR